MNILRYSLFGIVASQEVDHTFVKLIEHFFAFASRCNKGFNCFKFTCSKIKFSHSELYGA